MAEVADPPVGNRIRRWLRLYVALHGASLRGALQYRANTFLMMLVGIVYQGSGLASLWVVLHAFDSLGGWTMSSVAFLYGIRLLAHALSLVIVGGNVMLDETVRTGEFDRILLRPWNPLMLSITSRRGLEWVGDLSVGIITFGAAAVIAPVDWSLVQALFCVLAVVGGACIEAAFGVLASSLAFRVVDTWAIRWFVDDTVTTLATYPQGIFSAGAQRVLTYAIPVAFIAYLPSSVLLDREGRLAVPATLAYLSPVVGVGLFALATAVWHRSVRWYASAGGA
ncbi:ABC-2 type transport system permease protein [Motilibacter rhizosphaerae]|uniref:ABC-2 type transport system permease protein n=1 Tax=Motilibacter rhizosphaerae TaxID=598652 RepID=A0A4Q7NV90_9ACTN|nr:ABC-2 family transporter protein [Motilibacter rhizosphaerae]RZS91034.1 ABC-2 type transport system permease protein [Motilibacter rhizosphaerae]